jgi:hypothetical protein
MSVLPIYHTCGQSLYTYLTSSSCCASLLSKAGPLEVPVTYLRSLGYLLACDSLLLDGCSMEKLMLMGGPKCAACLGWYHTLSVCTLPP